jgi:hypothetical protein
MSTESDEEETFYDAVGGATGVDHKVPRPAALSRPSLELEEEEAESILVAVPSPSLKSQHIPARTTLGKAEKGRARKRPSSQARYDLTSFNGIVATIWISCVFSILHLHPFYLRKKNWM